MLTRYKVASLKHYRDMPVNALSCSQKYKARLLQAGVHDGERPDHPESCSEGAGQWTVIASLIFPIFLLLTILSYHQHPPPRSLIPAIGAPSLPATTTGMSGLLLLCPRTVASPRSPPRERIYAAFTQFHQLRILSSRGESRGRS
ncbi:hypothetical protein BJX66DRAFT_62636 [Aspergillus keveii]|uniref:Uncharacterized protein n=1 Tax=Aspergillus keveii TaxID=714993 RepID=A0ABR4GG71_9EURO